MGGKIIFGHDTGRIPDLQMEKRVSDGCLLRGILAVAILVGLLVTPALGAALVLSPSSGRAGSQVTATGSSFNVYSLEFASAWITFNGVEVASYVGIRGGGYDGTFTTSFTVPANTPDGTYTVQASGPRDSATATFTVTNNPPAANFDMNPSSGSGQAPLTVYFTDRSTRSPSSWSWNFGDGQSSSARNPSHTYTSPGTYTVTLTASNAAGSSSTSRTVTVYKPVLTLSPSSGRAGGQVTASGNSFSLIGKEFYFATISFNGVVLVSNIPMTRSGNLGSFTTPITIPANTAQGTFTVRADGPNDYATATFTVTNIPPDAQIDATPASGPGPLLVRFDGTRSSDPDGSINAYRWNFGDGTSAVGATAEHTYTRPDRYQATLTVTDNQGATDIASTLIVVDNSAPVAVAIADPESGSDPLMVTFDGSRSSDPDGNIRSYRWDFGDGSRGETSGTSHEYRTPGTYQAVLTVTDDNGKTGQDTVQITVGNEVPVARIMVTPLEGSAPLPVSLDGSQSSDKDDNNLTFSWNYGDGILGTGSKLAHTFQKEGTYQVLLQVTDPHGATGRASATVRVVQPFPWWFVVIGVLGVGVVGAVIFREWPRVFRDGDTLPEKCKSPEPKVQVDVRSDVECKPGTTKELPDITVEIRSEIWKEEEKR